MARQPLARAIGPVPAPAPEPNRHPNGVLLRAHGRGGVYDIVVYQDALFLSRAAGTDPLLMGALGGALVASVVGAVIGAIIGERLARAAAAKRLRDVFYAPPEYVFGAHSRNRVVRCRDVRFARFVEYGSRQRVLELRMRDGSRTRLKFNAHLLSNSFAAETLRMSLGTRMRVEHHRFRLVALLIGALVGTALVLLSAVVPAILAGLIS